MSIDEFADKNNLHIEIKKREKEKPGTKNRFYAKFTNCTIGGVYGYGNGRTRKSALQSYIRRIKGRIITANPSQSRNIRVPIDIHV